MADKKSKTPRGQPGPKPGHVKIDRDDWEDVVRDVIKKKRPPEGWPRPGDDESEAEDE